MIVDSEEASPIKPVKVRTGITQEMEAREREDKQRVKEYEEKHI
jgi:hypothetical protein